MPYKTTAILVLVLGIVSLLLAGGSVIAGTVTGEAPNTAGCPSGSGGCGGGSGGCGAVPPSLSDAQIEEIHRKEQAFFNATKDLRESIYNKKRALAGEFSKTDPDTEKTGALQSELNALKGEFNQKYIQFVTTMKKIASGSGSGSAKDNSQASCCTQQ